MDYRVEKDSVGKKEIPKDAYYGVNSLRGKENFNISGKKLHKFMIKSLAMIKKSCALANFKAGTMELDVKDAIIKTCDEILNGKLHDQFIVDPIQGGAGTTANMNANEVIANRANEIMGGTLGSYEYVNPNDHVNMGQSTNDVYPTSGKIGAILLTQVLLEELDKLQDEIHKKSIEFKDVIKMGRTQLQDAVPMTLGQEINAYSTALKRDITRINNACDSLKTINMGASAIGTGINVDVNYFNYIVEELSKVTDLKLKQAEDLMDGTSNQDVLAEFSGTLKTCAINLSKISNDLRLLSSGPKTMIGDINIPSRQNGSSIMPGKINPVIPEVVSQVSFKVIGNDMTVTMAAEGGQLQLNAFEPVMFYSIYESIEMLTEAIKTLRVNCIEGITANIDKLEKDVNLSVGTITALVPHIGYDHAARIADKSLDSGIAVRTLIEKEDLLSKEELDEILNVKAMTEPGIAAKHLLDE